MRKEKHIRFISFFLLVVYAISLVPSMAFNHHHEGEVVAFFEANSCEKAIYYNLQDEHSQHFNKTIDDCWICDHHTVPFQIITAYEFILSVIEIPIEYPSYHKSFQSVDLIGTSNKDPPFFI